jgi:uncharacterized membrane protein HdeD (DUF308 family)
MAAELTGAMRSTESAAPTLEADLCRNWWAIAIRGVLAILLGIVAIGLPGATMLSLVLLFAAYMLVDGAFAIIAAVRAARRHDKWGLLAFEGVVDIVTGIVAFAWPGLTVVAFVLLIAAWAIITGVLLIAAAIRLAPDHGRWWMVLGGVASLLYGVVLLVAPLVGALVLTWWLGVYALVFGVSLIVLALRLRARQRDHGSA